MSIPRPPAGLDVAGRRWWRATLELYELDGAEQRLLEALCGAADDLAAARADIVKNGLTTTGRYGQVVLSPAAVAARQAEVSSWTGLSRPSETAAHFSASKIRMFAVDRAVR